MYHQASAVPGSEPRQNLPLVTEGPCRSSRGATRQRIRAAGQNIIEGEKYILQDYPAHCELRKKYCSTEIILNHKLSGIKEELQGMVEFMGIALAVKSTLCEHKKKCIWHMLLVQYFYIPISTQWIWSVLCQVPSFSPDVFFWYPFLGWVVWELRSS